MSTTPVRFVRWEILAERVGIDPKTKNELLNYHRVIGLLTSECGTPRFVALLNLTGRKKIPDVLSAEEISRHLDSGRWMRSEFDPCVLKIRNPEDIAEPKRKSALATRDARFRLVKQVDSHGWDVFVPKRRSEIFRQVGSMTADGKPRSAPHSSHWIRDLVIRHWRSGGNSMAQLPGRLFNGSLSRKAQIERAGERLEDVTFGRKRGRKPVSPETAKRAGPEITPELYTRIVKTLPDILRDKDLQYILAHRYNLRRGIPWEMIRGELNSRLAPKLVMWGQDGAAIERSKQHQLLSRKQVQEIGKQLITVGDFVLLVKDYRQVELDHHVPRGDVRDVATRPGERYAVDIAIADAFFVHDDSLLPIGRIHIAFVTDCYSRAICAAYPWAGTPDARMITYALAAAAMPKSHWGEIIGEPFSDDEWPCQGMPETVVCDNGEAATHGHEHLGEVAFDIVPNRPYFAFHKQEVETSFHLANHGYIDILPASTKGPRERATTDRRQEARMRVALFTRQLNRWACHVANHRVMADYPEDAYLLRNGVKKTPIELFRAGCKRGSALAPYVRERHLPALLESRVVRVASSGLDLDGIYFDFPDEHCPTWFESLKRTATAGSAHYLRIHFDRLILNRVYLVPKDPSKTIVEVPLSRLSRQWADYSLAEYEQTCAVRGNENAALKHESDLRQTAFRQSVVAEDAEADSAIRSAYGTRRRRTDVARSVGLERPRQEQQRADTARDEKTHPRFCSDASKPGLADESPTPPNNAVTYDELLGLN